MQQWKSYKILFSKYAVGIIGLIVLAVFLFWQSEKIDIVNPENLSSSISENLLPPDPNADAPPQQPLANPPKIIKAIYFTGWSAGSENKVEYLINLAKKTEINAVVIDIKDYSGYVSYDIKSDEIEKYKGKEVKINKINSLIKRLHDENIYIIGRISVFQDPVLARARPDLAVHSKSKLMTNGQQLTAKTLWLDNKKLAWIDPTNQECWDYNIAIAKDAAERGFDELNFDYIRFPSDGSLEDMDFPGWDKITSKEEVIKNFFKYLREKMGRTRISADLFGLSTVNNGDLGIGQVIENAYQYFDYVAPMVYPSHYADGFNGYQNPALYPYEIIKYSMEGALQRLKNYELGIMNNGTITVSTTLIQNPSFIIHNSKLRPWLQDFNLGAVYDAAMVKKEFQAVYDVFCDPSSSKVATAIEKCDSSSDNFKEEFGGWMLWSPTNIYTQEALEPKG